MLGAARRLGLRARYLSHRPQPVQDPARKADGFGELLIDVDRVEVAGGTRIAGGEVLVRRYSHLGNLRSHS